ncbi:exosome complex exonuclease Rrp41 [Candidatus Woesearchaeota archaeon]|jgi:exosome complex component RRP41|nr:exosome complex exonuclease Rrp41 [Candidatus Woesearchaeota archaeon]
MVALKRIDGRKDSEDIRPMEAKAGVIPRADGSGWFKIGKTEAYAAVYGPRSLFPKFLQDPEKGVLRCNYNMMPFSGSGDRVRPGPSRRSKEISMVTKNALLPVIDLSEFPNSVVDVFIELPQTDAGSRCAGICAAAIALADAGIAMKDLVAAVAVGKVGDDLVVDLDYAEEAFEGGATDMAIAYTNISKELTLFQMDGSVTKDEVAKVLEMGKGACDKINAIQKAALKKRFECTEKNCSAKKVAKKAEPKTEKPKVEAPVTEPNAKTDDLGGEAQ